MKGGEGKMLFYFTATGNCLYVAREIEKNIFSIPQELKKKEPKYKDSAIGIVAPIYAGELPLIVRKFIEKAHFETDYFYLVLTYGANDSVASTWSASFCEDHHIHVDYIHTIKMVDNYVPSFDMNEEKSIDKHIDEQLKQVKEDLQNRVHDIPQPTETGIKLHETVKKRFNEHPELNDGELIKMTNKCEECRMCAKVCPRGNIAFKDNKAYRIHNKCDFCLACVHNCPFNAIIVENEKNSQARYRHPCISLKDIVLSNQQ